MFGEASDQSSGDLLIFELKILYEAVKQRKINEYLITIKNEKSKRDKNK
jgi:hypothetical protein